MWPTGGRTSQSSHVFFGETERESFCYLSFSPKLFGNPFTFFFFVCLSVLSGIFGLGVYSICRILRRTLELDFPSTKRFNYAGTLRRQNCNLRVFLYTAREKIVFWIHKSNRLKNDKQFYGKSFRFTYFYLYEKKK